MFSASKSEAPWPLIRSSASLEPVGGPRLIVGSRSALAIFSPKRTPFQSHGPAPAYDIEITFKVKSESGIRADFSTHLSLLIEHWCLHCQVYWNYFSKLLGIFFVIFDMWNSYFWQPSLFLDLEITFDIKMRMSSWLRSGLSFPSLQLIGSSTDAC